ncbi:MAG: ERF family protein, partial [Candidatus Omnitrophota bacterium]
METKKQELSIFQAMAKITSEVEAIGKNKINEQQRYKFRGIDDLYNTLHGLYGKYGITITSEPVNSLREERTTKNG